MNATGEENSPAPMLFPSPSSVSTEDPPSPVSPASTHEIRVLKLKKKVHSKKTRIKRLRSSPSVACKQKEELATIKSLSAKYLRANVYDFFCTQLDMSAKKKKRWNAQNESQSLSIYHVSPKAYLLLRKMFHLPPVTTMRRTMANLDMY